ncbi:unnamed protein product [Calicophoron daubneyi]|uniref:RRM domain-containing protein n=1 Tax=Calicophoron daubneyi TaxID=300641 RepID=A0AAV2TG63_CALDB
MDSNSPWVTPRSQYQVLSIGHVADYSGSNNGEKLSPAPSKVDVIPNEASQTKVGASNCSLFSGHKTSSTLSNFSSPSTIGPCPAGMGRPCLAGTQTAQHHMAIQNSPSTETSGSGVVNNLTRDSSGFGSLLSERCINSNPPEYSKNTERSACRYQWAGHRLNSLESDTSDLALDLDDAAQPQSPIRRSEYHPLGASAKMADLPKAPSQPPSGIMEEDNLYDTEAPYDEFNIPVSTTASGRESRMLEENLASVARYVEELTGCSTGTPTGGIKQAKADGDKYPNNQGRQESLIGTNNSASVHQQEQIELQRQQQKLNQLSQLQQINQYLSTLTALRSEKPNEKIDLLNIQTQDILLHLLTSQLPELLNCPTTVPLASKPDRSTWSGSNTTGIAAKPLFSPDQRLSVSQQQRQESTNQIRNEGIKSFSSSSTLSAVNNVSSTDTQPKNTHNSDTGFAGQANRNDVLQSALASLNPTILNLLSQLGNLGASEARTPPSPIQPTSSNISTAALLASLFGMNSTHSTNSGIRPSNENPHSSEAARSNVNTTTLANILANLQSTPNQTSLSRSGQNRGQDRELTARLSSGKITEEISNSISTANSSQDSVPSPNNLSEELTRLASPYRHLLAVIENDIERAVSVYRNSASAVAQKSEAAYHWSGKLPVRVYRSMTFSRKVFLGGVPWDSTSEDLIMAFSRFGNVTISWPQKESCFHGMYSRNVSPKGYCYLIFEHEASVADLIAACVRDPATGGDYYKISSSKFKSKDVQVIPWVISDSQYTKSGPYRPDAKKTVFIGALHGMITAEALVTIMNDLFGNVVFAALDTDKYKYPIGSGRVVFSSYKSFVRAVTANFVDVRTPKFIKTIQIDPYLEDSFCQSCYSNPGIYFCRAFECFRYFCPACWKLWHSTTETLLNHKPLRRSLKPVADRQWPNAMKF